MKHDWWDKEFEVLMTIGASITAGGWSSCRQRCWADQLAKLIDEFQRRPVQLINVGIGANVVSTKSAGYKFSSKPAASERLDKHVLSNTANGNLIVPDLLIISYGQNDARSGTDVNLFCSEMKDIIRRIREKIQPLMVLLGPYYMTDFTLGGPEWSHASLEVLENYNNAVCEVAEECDCLFVDILESFHRTDWFVHYDGVHTNDLGHRIIANKIFEVLASKCSGLAKETKELEKTITPWRDESTLQED